VFFGSKPIALVAVQIFPAGLEARFFQVVQPIPGAISVALFAAVRSEDDAVAKPRRGYLG